MSAICSTGFASAVEIDNMVMLKMEKANIGEFGHVNASGTRTQSGFVLFFYT